MWAREMLIRGISYLRDLEAKAKAYEGMLTAAFKSCIGPC